MMIKCLIFISGLILIAKIEEIEAELGDPDCQICDVCVVNSDGEVSIATGSNTTNRLTFGGGINIYHDGNMKFENYTGYLKLQCNNQINIDGSPIYFRN